MIGRRLAAATPLCLLLTSLLLMCPLMVSCAGTTARPSSAEWSSDWAERQLLIPDAMTIVAGGQPLCDELNGLFRVELPELLPTPAEVLDDPVDQWIERAVSIVFECSSDEAVLGGQLESLSVLTAEIDGGLEGVS